MLDFEAKRLTLISKKCGEEQPRKSNSIAIHRERRLCVDSSNHLIRFGLNHPIWPTAVSFVGTKTTEITGIQGYNIIPEHRMTTGISSESLEHWMNSWKTVILPHS